MDPFIVILGPKMGPMFRDFLSKTDPFGTSPYSISMGVTPRVRTHESGSESESTRPESESESESIRSESESTGPESESESIGPESESESESSGSESESESASPTKVRVSPDLSPDSAWTHESNNRKVLYFNPTFNLLIIFAEPCIDNW